MARKRPVEAPPAPANPTLVANALAKAVAEGDIVNFRMVFAPFSPARDYTAEDFSSVKYRHLLVDETIASTSAYKTALESVQNKDTWDHIQRELQESRPPCLPSDLLMLMADNAVRLGKYTAAAQAYEVLRIRERIQMEFAEEADKLMASGEINRAVKGYDIAASLNYNYAGFPDPHPLGNDYQTRALMLHGEYPRHPEDCVAALPAERFLETAFEYLLNDRELSKRLIQHPLDVQIDFLTALIRRGDPVWDEFAHRFNEACTILQRFAAAVASEGDDHRRLSIQNELDAEQAGDPWVLPVALLGRELEDAQWWRYLKELAVKHPAAPLFIARQLMGGVEVLVPRFSPDSNIPSALGLTSSDPVPPESALPSGTSTS